MSNKKCDLTGSIDAIVEHLGQYADAICKLQITELRESIDKNFRNLENKVSALELKINNLQNCAYQHPKIYEVREMQNEAIKNA